MGNCVTLLRASGPKCSDHVNQECAPIEMLIQENSVGPQGQISEHCFNPQRASFPETSNTEETFFDSQPNLDSDCEDFFSVNGDTTPSLNNTPKRRSRAGETTSPLGESFHVDDEINSQHKPAPSKLLIELFQESLNRDDQDESQSSHRRQDSKTAYLSIVNFVCSSKRTQSTNSDIEYRKDRQPAKCCLPNLVRSTSLSEKKKDT